MSIHGERLTFGDFVEHVSAEFLRNGSWALTDTHRRALVTRTIEQGATEEVTELVQAFRQASARCEAAGQTLRYRVGRLVDLEGDGWAPGLLGLGGAAWGAAVYFKPAWLGGFAALLAHWYYPVVFVVVGMFASMFVSWLLKREHGALEARCNAARAPLTRWVQGSIRTLLVDPGMTILARAEGCATFPRPYVYVAAGAPLAPDEPGAAGTLERIRAVRAAAAAIGQACHSSAELAPVTWATEHTTAGIAGAELVVADLACGRPGLDYELGLARGMGKRIVPLAPGAAIEEVLRHEPLRHPAADGARVAAG